MNQYGFTAVRVLRLRTSRVSAEGAYRNRIQETDSSPCFDIYLDCELQLSHRNVVRVLQNQML